MATANISYSDVSGFPAGSAVSAVNVAVTNPDATTQSLVATPGQTSVSFDATQVGAYSVSVQAVDANGVPLGTAATASFSVAAPQTVTLSLPATVAVSQP